MKQSLQQYRRLGALQYARWVCQANGVTFSEEMMADLDNHGIHAMVANLMNPVEEEVNPLVQEEVANPFPEEIQMYDSLTVVELKAICVERELPVYGTKAELILRLKQNDIPEEESDGPTEVVAPEDNSEAPTDEVAASNGEEINDKNSSNKQEPVNEE
tara:strand:- start:4570 stop:5046 length:477 start_codon:yes stop_codon:yes gene_type:complete